MPKDDYIVFDGQKSTDFGLSMASDPIARHPSRRYGTFVVAGRNGYVLRDDGTYDAYTQDYDVFFDARLDEQHIRGAARKVAEWLLGANGLCRLEDSYEPEYYRIARYSGALNVEDRLIKFGRATLTFECQPQRYLKTGEMQIRFTENKLFSFLAFRGMTAYGVPNNVASIKVVAEKETTTVKLTNPDTGIETVGTPHLDDDEWSGMYVTEIEKAEGDTQLDVRLGHKSNPLIVDNGTVVVLFVSEGGEETQIAQFTDDDFILVNPTDNIAKPLLRFWKNNDQTAESEELYAFSNVEINGTTVALDFSDGDEIILDCDLHDAKYPLGGNANSKVTFTSETDAYPTFPTFGAGLQRIKPTDGYYLSFLISPRWWAL